VEAFPRLINVHFNNIPLGKADLRVLGNRPLNVLQLNQSQADLSGLRGCKVAYLHLRDNHYEPADIAPLAGSSIANLYLDRNLKLDDRMATTLLAIKDLEFLSVEETSLTSQGFTRLAEHPFLGMVNISALQEQLVTGPTKAALDANKIHIIRLR